MFLPPERRNLGLVFQSYALWPQRTVYENVAYGLRLRKVPEKAVRERVLGLLDRLGLTGLEPPLPGGPLRGQQQRVSLARALAYDPKLLLLDEPLSNLDAKLRDQARVWLRETLKATGKAALFVTHDQGEAMAIADRIALLNEGRMEQVGTPEELYRNPKTLFVADFLGNPNVVEALVVGPRDPRPAWSLRASPCGPGPWGLWSREGWPSLSSAPRPCALRAWGR